MKITMRGANVYFSRPCTRGSSTSSPTKNISEFENWFALKKFRANFTIKSSERVFESEGLIKVNLAKGIKKKKKKKTIGNNIQSKVSEWEEIVRDQLISIDGHRNAVGRNLCSRFHAERRNIKLRSHRILHMRTFLIFHSINFWISLLPH